MELALESIIYYLASPSYNRISTFSVIIFIVMLILAFLGSGPLSDVVTGFDKKAKHIKKIAAERNLTPSEMRLLQRMVRKGRIKDLDRLLSDLDELAAHLKRVSENEADRELRESILQKFRSSGIKFDFF